jgi:hypothetical protein
MTGGGCRDKKRKQRDARVRQLASWGSRTLQREHVVIWWKRREIAMQKVAGGRLSRRG